MNIRPAQLSDAPAMGRIMVETYLRAHHGQLPEGAWMQRQKEWTPEVSALAWARSICDIANGSAPDECMYVAVETDAAGNETVIGLVMGGPGEFGPWPQVGDIYALYIDFRYHRRGVGRQLIQAAVAHLRQCGMTALTIGSLPENAPANAFYEALGGQIVGEREGEDEGYPIVERMYGWADSSVLLEQQA